MKDLEFLISSIIAHRGLYNNEKGIIENSIEAFELAISKKYIIELDIHILKDGTVVVFHDNNLKRITNYNKDIKDCTYQEIKELKMYNQNTFIPKLEDVLTLINGRVPILIELKYDMPTGMLEEKVMQILNNYQGKYAIQSFNPLTLKWFKKKYPNVIRGQLSCDFKDEKNIFKKFILKNMLFNFITKPDFISYCVDNLSLKEIQKIKKKSMILGWTIKEKRVYEKLINYYDNLICEKFIFGD